MLAQSTKSTSMLIYGWFIYKSSSHVPEQVMETLSHVCMAHPVNSVFDSKPWKQIRGTITLCMKSLKTGK